MWDRFRVVVDSLRRGGRAGSRSLVVVAGARRRVVLQLESQLDSSQPNEAASSVDAVLSSLENGEIVDCKPIPWGSNYTFAVVVQVKDESHQLAIYKPRRGEAPLRDFPSGTLYRRERAAYLLCRALGWEFIPPTVIRDGPHGIGSVQLYVEPDTKTDYFKFRDKHVAELRRICVFDVIANNADRKSIHTLKGADGRIWGIDHGLTFNAWPKLRTVIWDYCGEPIDADLMTAIDALAVQPGSLIDDLAPLLADRELEAFRTRLDRVAKERTYPMLDPYRNVPYEWF